MLTTVTGTCTQSPPPNPPPTTAEHVVEMIVVTRGGMVVILSENVALCPVVMTVLYSVSVGIGTHAIHQLSESLVLPELRLWIPSVEGRVYSERKWPGR